jgi:SAM-dependent methyltransferase
MKDAADMTAGRRARIAALAYDPGAGPTQRAGPCNLCGSLRRVQAARTDRYGYAIALAICPDCGLGFLDPRPTGEAYAAFYRDVYRPLVSAYHGRRIDAETVQDEQRTYAAELVAWLREALPESPRTIIDIGGSTGVVAAAFVDAFGAQATVLDPAPDELAVAAAGGAETIAAFAEDYDPGERRFDLVLLCQTIDHLLDIRATLAGMRRMVADGGHAFVDVLDVGFMLERRGTIEGAVKVDHPYYLTRTTGRAFLKQAGFAVLGERMSDDGHWGFLAQAAAPATPDPAALRGHADALLARLWRLRARA